MDERLIGRIFKSAPLAGALFLSASYEMPKTEHAAMPQDIGLCSARYEMRGQFVQPIMDAADAARAVHRGDIGEEIMTCPDYEVNMAITFAEERVLRAPYTTLDAEEARADTLDILLASRRLVDERRTQAANGAI